MCLGESGKTLVHSPASDVYIIVVYGRRIHRLWTDFLCFFDVGNRLALLMIWAEQHSLRWYLTFFNAMTLRRLKKTEVFTRDKNIHNLFLFCMSSGRSWK